MFAQEVDIELFTNGFSNPVNLQHAGDERLFVVEQGGKIKILSLDGTTVNPVPFLDISSEVSCCGEQGLLGLAFHPEYDSNGYFYVDYINTNGDTQVSRFTTQPGAPDLADPSSELPLLTIDQPFSNHNGGSIAFGPDGYLYISTGDGGSGGDPGNRAQNTTLLLGKLLRINVDNPSGGNNYGIPADNPFVGNPAGLDEIWAYGLRNPWKMSFDRSNGDLWIGDVGQGEVEEIDRVSVTDAGLNFGWRCYEGSAPYNTSGCPDIGELTFPVAEYSSGSSTSNCSITGGYVYRGNVYSDIQGLYLFADYCSGLIGTVDDSGNLIEHGNFGGNWVSFGEDVNGELYILNISGGSIYKITGGVLATSDFNEKLQVTMIPNPTSEYINLRMETGKITNVIIYDLKGSVLFSEENKGISEKNISVKGFTQGVYMVKIIAEDGNSIIKKLAVN